MAGELQAHSSSREGATVYWITIHTAEGATDEFPSRPDLDSGSARDLLQFGMEKNDRSWHACCDDDVLLDNLVSYDRAAWTLRGGNRYSDNLEMCGIASWSRVEWLTHDGMIRNAAKWTAQRLKARGMTPGRVSIAECAAKSKRGYMDHNTYTQAYHDGTHTDVGPHFPWDVFGNYVVSIFNGQEEDPMAGYSLADDARGKAAVRDMIHEELQYAVGAVLKGGSNSAFKGLPTGEVTAVQQVEDKVDQVIDLLSETTEGTPQ